jgi:site-specific DNA-methyltransferase (adenine-specific)
MSTDPTNKILLGDCLDVLKTLPDASVDAVVSDPPYGLGTKEPTGDEIDAYLNGGRLDVGGDFMGAEWDLPSVAVWQEIRRVVKPGGYVLAFAGTLTDEETFAKKFGPSVLQWTHSQGFPKSLNVFKQLQKTGVDPKIARKWDGYGTSLKPSWEPILVFKREGDAFVRPNLDAPFFYTGKATKSETSLKKEKDAIDTVENDHPTKKPLALMGWLVNLAVPKGGLVLDPYCGSGSTCHAALEEGMRFIGIERDPHFHEIATKRLNIVLARKEREQDQTGVLDMMEQLSED